MMMMGFAAVVLMEIWRICEGRKLKTKEGGNGRIMYWGTGRRDATSLALKFTEITIILPSESAV